MRNEILKKIFDNKEITTDDKITFRTILDVLSTLFTDENHVSTLLVGWKISATEHILFPNITLNSKKEVAIKNGYANYMSEDKNYFYQFDSTKGIEKRKKLGEKQKNYNIHLVIFAKFIEKDKEIGYYFMGVFIFDGYEDEECNTMIYKKN